MWRRRLIANAVWPDDNPKSHWPGVHRQPANEAAPDSDLGTRLVTVDVDRLPDQIIKNALRRGAGVAEDMRQSGENISRLWGCAGSRLHLRRGDDQAAGARLFFQMKTRKGHW